MKSRKEMNERVRRGQGWGDELWDEKEKREKKRNIDSPTALLKITCGGREEQSTKGKVRQEK